MNLPPAKSVLVKIPSLNPLLTGSIASARTTLKDTRHEVAGGESGGYTASTYFAEPSVTRVPPSSLDPGAAGEISSWAPLAPASPCKGTHACGAAKSEAGGGAKFNCL